MKIQPISSAKSSFKSFKSAILYVLLVAIFIFISLPSVSAQESCCVTRAGCQSGLNTAQCDDLYGEFRATSCTDLEGEGGVCAPGCCCAFTGSNTASLGYFTSQAECKDELFKYKLFDSGVTVEQKNAECEVICNANMVSVSGKVVHEDGISSHASASLVFSVVGEANRKYVVSTDPKTGEYSRNILIGESYTVLATGIHNTSCTKSASLNNVNSDVSNFDFTLPCVPPNQEECYDEWKYEFDEGTCGYLENVTYIGTCVPAPDKSTAPLKEGYFIACLESEEDCKPNGLSDPNEDCDPYINALPPEALCAAPLLGYKTCTMECVWSDHSCYLCPESPEFCTEESCNANCPECIGSPVCINQGNCSKEANLVIDEAQGVTRLPLPEKGFLVKWSFEENTCEAADVIRYNLYGCASITGDVTEVGNCDGDYEVVQEAIPATTNMFKHKDLFIGSDKYFCYQVEAEMKDSLLDPKKSDFVCKSLKKDICADNPGVESLCDGNIKITCPGNIAEVCTDKDQTCSQITDKKADCFSSEVCEYCSGPFNLFGYENYMINDIPEFRSIVNAGYSDKIENCDQVETDAHICYKDDYSLSKTNVGQYKACSTIKSCYDYRTQYSCEQDSCDKTSKCNWVPYGEEVDLGMGVCIPENVSEQDCTQCDENSLLGKCTQDICHLYGTQLDEDAISGKYRCYYNSLTNQKNPGEYSTDKNICINREYVSCETYDTITECIGNQSVNFIVDLNPLLTPKSGTNKILQNSSDIYNLGKCFWDYAQERCFRDADNSRLYDAKNHSDCAEKTSATPCLTDMQAPNTTLDLKENGYYSGNEIKSIAYTIEDNVYTSRTADKLVTYFRVHKRGAYDGGYPLETNTQNLDFSAGPGEYVIAYFSKDKAGNLEEVKSMTVNIMETLENGLSLVTSTTSEYVPQSDVYETNLSVKVDVNLDMPEGSWLKCKSVLTIEGSTDSFMGQGDGTKAHPNLFWNYTSLQDGSYDLDVYCYDDHLQTITLHEDINVEADPTISEPSPRLVKPPLKGPAGNVEISIKTNASGECAYTLTKGYTPPIENPVSTKWDEFGATWKNYTVTGGTTHKTNITSNDDGVYLIFSACKFDVDTMEEHYFYGNFGDMIYYVVDGLAPNVSVTRHGLGQEYLGYGYPTESITLDFECNDENKDLVYGNKDYSAGCENIKLCEFSVGVSTCIPTRKIDKTETFSPADAGQIKGINYSAEDMVGNIRYFTPKRLDNLRDLTFRSPDIVICDPEVEGDCE